MCSISAILTVNFQYKCHQNLNGGPPTYNYRAMENSDISLEVDNRRPLLLRLRLLFFLQKVWGDVDSIWGRERPWRLE